MAGNIIPAIATTNAVIAGLIVLEGLKILSGQIESCRTVSLVSSVLDHSWHSMVLVFLFFLRVCLPQVVPHLTQKKATKSLAHPLYVSPLGKTLNGKVEAWFEKPSGLLLHRVLLQDMLVFDTLTLSCWNGKKKWIEGTCKFCSCFLLNHFHENVLFPPDLPEQMSQPQEETARPMRPGSAQCQLLRVRQQTWSHSEA